MDLSSETLHGSHHITVYISPSELIPIFSVRLLKDS